jgi:Mn-dependent DtxR family transcriptional regulator
MPPTKYLHAVNRLTDGGETNTSTSELAEELGVSDPSASEAVQKLEEQDMICRAPYKGFTLSPFGRKKASQVSDKKRKLKSFFREIGVEEPEEEAEKVSGVISDEAVEKIYRNGS